MNRNDIPNVSLKLTYCFKLRLVFPHNPCCGCLSVSHSKESPSFNKFNEFQENNSGETKKDVLKKAEQKRSALESQ